MAQAQNIAQKKTKKTPSVPAYLIRDLVDGVPYYYKGYRSVLNGTKTLEDIMGCSTLQASIIMYLNTFFLSVYGVKKFWIFTGESGNNLAKKVNLSFDIAIYDKKVLTAEKIDAHYANVPPKIVVEVDVKVDTGQKTELEFIEEKTQKLLDYGVEKVLWVITKNQKVLIANPQEDWYFRNWNKGVELKMGAVFNIGQYLKEEGIILKK